MAGAAGCGGSGDTRGWGGAGGSGGLCYSSCTGGGTCVCGPGRTGAKGSSGNYGANGTYGSAGLSGSTHGGGIYVSGSGVTFNNTLAAANDAQTGPDGYGQLTVAGRNFIQDITGLTLTGDVGAVINGLAPQLGPLQDNGGPTYTRAPLPGSPVIDAGDNANCPATDQRGYMRPADGDGNGEAICDIGAVEYGALAPAAPHAAFDAAPTIGLKPLTVNFTNISTGDYTSSEWNFGDGITSAETSPTHIYQLPGTYTVTLTVTGAGGTDTLTRTDYILVRNIMQVYLPLISR